MEDWLDTVSMDLMFLNICTHILGHTERASSRSIKHGSVACVRTARVKLAAGAEPGGKDQILEWQKGSSICPAVSLALQNY